MKRRQIAKQIPVYCGASGCKWAAWTSGRRPDVLSNANHWQRPSQGPSAYASVTSLWQRTCAMLGAVPARVFLRKAGRGKLARPKALKEKVLSKHCAQGVSALRFLTGNRERAGILSPLSDQQLCPHPLGLHPREDIPRALTLGTKPHPHPLNLGPIDLTSARA